MIALNVMVFSLMHQQMYRLRRMAVRTVADMHWRVTASRIQAADARDCHNSRSFSNTYQQDYKKRLLWLNPISCGKN